MLIVGASGVEILGCTAGGHRVSDVHLHFALGFHHAAGRLVMFDALVLAVKAGVDAVVDIATLTAACLRTSTLRVPLRPLQAAARLTPGGDEDHPLKMRARWPK